MNITACRVCGNPDLVTILDLGEQAYTGVFPRTREEQVPTGPLELVRCSPSGCGLVQLRDTPDPGLMYGEDYAYRSGIRPFMVDHLASKVRSALEWVDLGPNDLVVDIGSNDATLLSAIPPGPALLGIDPSAEKFRDRYPEGTELCIDYFSADRVTERFGDRKATLVTSIAMFYDLPDPLSFMGDIRSVLAPEGVWLAEQSYALAMIEADAYDVVCHEHLTYYALAQLEWMAERVGLKVVGVRETDVYGGSLEVVFARDDSPLQPREHELERVRARERDVALETMRPYEEFASRIDDQRVALRDHLDRAAEQGLTVLGYGASTKGNVILQYCGITEADLACIGEVSPEKHGRFTPGSLIPIVSEEEALSRDPDQLLVLPWIYRDGFVEREQQFVADGGSLVFPLPRLEVVER